ncbi:MAG: DUF3426 domain-containing protein [Desulfuromonadaceae bacterium]
MIIQCEKCQTRFRLDDSRVTAKGVKVRCTKCKHVFRVQKEDTGAELVEPEGESFGFSFPDEQGKAPAAAPEEQQFAAESVTDAPADSGAFGDISLRNEQAGFTPFDTSPFDASAISFDSEELQVDGSENVPAAADEPAADGGEVDFSSFDFGDTDPEPDSTAPSTLTVDDFTPPLVAPRKVAQQGLDFSDDDMFGAVVQSAPEPSSSTITFDFEGDSFAESMEMSGQDSGGKGGTSFSLDSSGDAPFSLGEIDFGDELTSVAVQQVNPDDLKPSHEILFAPLAEAREKSADDELRRAFLDENAAGDQELPPLSIASRRKQSPLFGVLISVVALLVIAVLGYYGYSSFSASKGTAALEKGRISVRAVKAAFIENDQAGELLVISGEALNEFPHARAALQVTVTVFDAAGQSVATKTAYGGNPLTEEQLESMPLDKIDATMTNQFGDSLANMEVAPGTAIPFLVVLANLPKGARDFVVQSAGSTVATGKQQ